MQMLITRKQTLALLKARGMTPSARKAEKKTIFAAIHREHGIPTTRKLVFFLDNPDNPLYRVIRDKRTKLPLDDGKVAPVVQAAPTAKPVSKKAAAPKAKAPAKAAPKASTKAKAPVAKKAAAKPATKPSKGSVKQPVKVATKVAAKKPAAKAVAKKVAKK